MKKLHVRRVAFCTVLALSVPAFAQYTGPQKQVSTMTVAAATNAVDDTHVVLEGFIASKIRDEHYVFKDATGTIEIEIDAKHFPTSTPVSDKTKVRIHGKVDKDFGRDATIDVKQVDVL